MNPHVSLASAVITCGQSFSHIALPIPIPAPHFPGIILILQVKYKYLKVSEIRSNCSPSMLVKFSSFFSYLKIHYYFHSEICEHYT